MFFAVGGLQRVRARLISHGHRALRVRTLLQAVGQVEVEVKLLSQRLAGLPLRNTESGDRAAAFAEHFLKLIGVNVQLAGQLFLQLLEHFAELLKLLFQLLRVVRVQAKLPQHAQSIGQAKLLALSAAGIRFGGQRHRPLG